MYRPRILDRSVESALRTSGGVLIDGVRASGKTQTGRHHAASVVILDGGSPSVAAALQVDPRLLLEGETPRLVDEWQLAPELWNTARHEIDRRGTKGQFIFTGSSVPAQDAMRHSGAHRFVRLRMRPMTLEERGLGVGTVSLGGLFDGDLPTPALTSPMDVPTMLSALVHGGWPADLDLVEKDAQRNLRAYLEDVAVSDIARLDDEPRRNPRTVTALLRSLARNLSSELKLTTIAADMRGVGDIQPRTVSGYIGSLERIFLVEEQYAWSPQIRSKTAIRSASKVHFVDPALAAAALGASSRKLLADLNTAGFWFESMVVQHMRSYMQELGGQVMHYRDKAGREVDVIVELPDGRWGAIEVKLGQPAIPAGAKSLMRFLEVVDNERMGAPSFAAVVTADGPTMTLEGGVTTFPLAALTA